MSENALWERVTAAAEERHLSENTLIAYRRIWLNAIAWAAAEGLALETLEASTLPKFRASLNLRHFPFSQLRVLCSYPVVRLPNIR